MSSPVTALSNAIRQWLLADIDLIAMLHHAKIYADVPRHTAFPYVAFVSSRASENGTSSDDGHVTEMVLGIWSRHKGSEEGLTIASIIEQRLKTVPQELLGHRLINLVTRSVEPLRQRDGETWMTEVRIRAVTEVV